MWVLIVNWILVIFLATDMRKGKTVLVLIFTISLPLIVSSFLFNIPLNEDPKKKILVAVTQPNENSMLKSVNEVALMDNIFDSLEVISRNREVVLVLPETIIKERVWENQIQNCLPIKRIQNEQKVHPNISCVVGLIMNSSVSTILNNQEIQDFKSFDAGLYLIRDSTPQFHFKSRLIPIEEYMPSYMRNFGFKSDDFSYGTDTSNFKLTTNKNFSPIICYEAIFGQTVARMVEKSSEVIIMIANEQMLGGKFERDGYTDLSKLRAIENRRYLIKSSNIGFSGLIDPRGEIVGALESDKFGVNIYEVPLLEKQTFYTRFYWIIDSSVILISFLFLAYSLAKLVWFKISPH